MGGIRGAEPRTIASGASLIVRNVKVCERSELPAVGGIRGAEPPGRDVVGDLVEGVADRHFRRDLGDREAGRLGRQRARSGDPGVHLDHDDPAIGRVHGELDIAAAGVDADFADDVDADVAQALVFAVRERQCGRDCDRVARVHSHRVEVLDGADDNDVVGAVAHDLEFVLLPPKDGLLQEHLRHRGVVQPGAGDPAEVGLVIREAGAESPHGEGRSDDHGIVEFRCRSEAFVHRVADDGAGRLGAAALDDALELLAVLAKLDGIDIGADERAVIPLQDAALVQGHRRIERGLAAEGRQDSIRPLFGNDLFDDLRGDRLDIGGVRELGVGHDRRRVGVDEDDPDALFTQHPAGLRARVVELACLSDHNRTGANDQNAGNVFALGHQARASLCSRINVTNRSNR